MQQIAIMIGMTKETTNLTGGQTMKNYITYDAITGATISRHSTEELAEKAAHKYNRENITRSGTFKRIK